jgi:hypothetical protein
VLATVALGRTCDQKGVSGADVAVVTRLVSAPVTVGHQSGDLSHAL